MANKGEQIIKMFKNVDTYKYLCYNVFDCNVKGNVMNGIFLKFKRRFTTIRLVRALMVAATAGMTVGGIWLLLWKRAVIEFDPIFTLIAGGGAGLLAGLITFLAGRKTNKRLAEELDESFGLKARVQTMIAYQEEHGDMLTIQREDTERELSKIPLKSYKFKKLWLFILILAISIAPLTLGVIADDARDYVPPEVIVPFELSAMQEQGLTELIRQVENSDLEDEFKLPMVEELNNLLAELKEIKTEPEMQATLARSMEVIRQITYDSSTSTEVLNALWDSQDVYLRYLAKALDTSDWTSPDWAAFAEGLNEYYAVLIGENKRTDDTADQPTPIYSLKWSLDSMSRSIKPALENSGVPEDDEIIVAINRLYYGNPGGFIPLLNTLNYMTEQEAMDSLSTCFDFNSKSLYDALSLNKVNANVGEHAMTRLASLFKVPLPEFERPEFVKTGESVEIGGSSSGEEDSENKPGDGGVGEGATFGSDDLVLDPLTGKLVPLGDLIHKYYAIMNEKLDGDLYTEEQKAIIKKYFDMLYYGVMEKEGK